MRKKQKRTPCKSCPWIDHGLFGSYFPPDVLQNTVVNDINIGITQTCHSEAHQTFCAGALAFQKRNGTLCDNIAVRYGLQHGFLKEDMIDPAIKTFSSIDEMIEYHSTMSQIHDAFD